MSVMEKPRITFRRMADGPCWQITWPFARVRALSAPPREWVPRAYQMSKFCKLVGLRDYIGRGFVRDEAQNLEADFFRFREFGSAG